MALSYQVAAICFWLIFWNHKTLMSLMEKRMVLLNAFLSIVYCIAQWEVNFRIQGIMEQISFLSIRIIFNSCSLTSLRVFSAFLARLEFLEFHWTQIRLILALSRNGSNTSRSKRHHRLCLYYCRRQYFGLWLILTDSLWLYFKDNLTT